MIQELAEKIGKLRLDPNTEYQTQQQIMEAFNWNPNFRSEYRLSDQDRIDFFCQGVGIEVKIGTAKPMEVMRQLERYAQHDEIKGLR